MLAENMNCVADLEICALKMTFVAKNVQYESCRNLKTHFLSIFEQFWMDSLGVTNFEFWHSRIHHTRRNLFDEFTFSYSLN